MTTPVVPESAEYQPSIAQIERAAALRRFNWLFIYAPVALVSLAVLTLISLLLWGALSPKIEGTREFASALADIVVIVTTIPLMLLCVIGPVLAIAYAVYRSKQPDRPHGRLHMLLWRVEALVTRVQGMADRSMSRPAHAVITGHAWAAYVGALWQQLKRLVSRS